jgi:DNA-binding transcriptional ArsR family regulator
MRIVFSADDLARTRLIAPACSVSETLFAARLVDRTAGGPLFDRWRRGVRVNIGRGMPMISALVRSVRPSAELFRVPIASFDAAAAASYGLARVGDVGRNLLRAFHDTAMAPYHQMVSTFLEDDRAARGNILLGDGVEGFFRTLQPLVSWHSPVLEIAGRSGGTIQLDGRGLLITPSLFFFDRPDVFTPRCGGLADPPVLVYNPPLSVATVNRLWDRDHCNEKALAALVGRTRGKLLGALANGFTTTELGRKLGVSAASVSQHTGVLREAGLITTDRRRNTVRHTLTPLGIALVRQQKPADEASELEISPAAPGDDLLEAS